MILVLRPKLFLETWSFCLGKILKSKQGRSLNSRILDGYALKLIH